MIIDSKSIKKKKNSRYILFSFFLLASIISEIFYRKPLFDASLNFIENAQNSKFLLKISSIISYGGSIYIYFSLSVLVYNFVNTYKSFILTCTLFIASLVVGALKMVYISPRPYWILETKIISYGPCDTGWGNPSGHSLTNVAIFLTLWHILFDCEQLRNRNILKYLTFAFAVLCMITIFFARVVVGSHSFNQVLYGSCLGFCIYFFTFYVLRIEVNNPEQLVKILESRTLIYFLVNVLIFIFILLLYLFASNDELTKYYEEIIKHTACKDEPLSKLLQNEGFLTVGIFLSNMSAYIGLKLEYYFSFHGNYENWKLYNFEEDEMIDDNQSLMSTISVNKETQWNHTSIVISIIRLIIISLLTTIPMLMFILIPSNINLYVQLVFKVFVPLSITIFGVFFLFKPILKRLKLTNNSLYTIILEKI